MKFVRAIADIDIHCGTTVMLGVVLHLPHQGSLPDSPRREQEQIVSLQIAPEERHLLDSVEKIVPASYCACDISHKTSTTFILYNRYFVQQIFCTTYL
jgi:hypothetical protein